MAQFARPAADTVAGSYIDQASGSANLFQAIDEAVASDADYIQSPLAPANAVYVCAMSAIEDPLTSTGHVVRYRYAKNASGGAQIDLTVQLRQGYVNEGAQGTLIAAWSHTDISDVWVNAAQTLTSGQADSITNYASLFLRFVSNQV